VNIRRSLTFAVLLLSGFFGLSRPLRAQQDQLESKRKVVNRVMPSYPDIARSMHIRGVVRIEAVVAPSGLVKSTSILGGHPLLAQSADQAVHKWKWEAASGESKEVVEVKFDPDNR
jgi:TonB family protein